MSHRENHRAASIRIATILRHAAHEDESVAAMLQTIANDDVVQRYRRTDEETKRTKPILPVDLLFAIDKIVTDFLKDEEPTK